MCEELKTCGGTGEVNKEQGYCKDCGRYKTCELEYKEPAGSCDDFETGEVDKIRESLKPCPCCKSNRIINYWTENNLYVIECDECGLMVAKQHISTAEKAWNTRTAEAEVLTLTSRVAVAEGKNTELEADCKNLIEVNNNQAKIVEELEAFTKYVSGKLDFATEECHRLEAEIKRLKQQVKNAYDLIMKSSTSGSCKDWNEGWNIFRAIIKGD